MKDGVSALPVKKRSGLKYTLGQYWKYRWLIAIMLPSIVMLIIFKYVPIYGVQIAFKNFRLKQGIWGSPWVGLNVFRKVFNMPIVDALKVEKHFRRDLYDLVNNL